MQGVCVEIAGQRALAIQIEIATAWRSAAGVDNTRTVMKLDKLRELQKQLTDEFEPESVKPKVYYYFQGRWNGLDPPSSITNELTVCLAHAVDDSIAYHPPSSKVAWFDFPGAACAVSLEFPKSPRRVRQIKSRDRIQKVIDSASNAFQVAHNAL